MATALSERVDHGVYLVGDRLPSIRQLCQEFQVSIATAQQAYRRLEEQGMVLTRPRSGYFVASRAARTVLPRVSRPVQRPLMVSQWDEVLELLEGSFLGDHPVMLGQGIPVLDALTLRPLLRHLSRLNRPSHFRSLSYGGLSGCLDLRRHVATLAAQSGALLHPSDILITTGCQEALSLGLRTLTEPGDAVAVESPSFYGTMQILKALGLKALEIPTDPQTGISLMALELALEQWPVRAIQVTPTVNNPLGYTMPDSRKEELVALAKRFDVPIVEDDIFGDLTFSTPRPRTVKSFDSDGRVLLCSSFSKTLVPGLRLGWIDAGRYRDQVLHMKYVSSGASAILPQLAVAEFIAKGHYDHHLRKMIRYYRRQRDIMLDWVRQYFPEETGVSYPQGGFLLWLELPWNLDYGHFHRILAQEQIHIATGSLFSAGGKYGQCLRLSYALPLNAEVEKVVRRIGEIAAYLLK